MKTKIFFLIAFFSLTFSWGQATLPVNRTIWNAGAPTGWTDGNATTPAYATTFACSGNNGGRLDNTGEYYQVNFSSSPANLTFVTKATGTPTGCSILVEESADASTWTTVTNLTSLTTTCATNGAYSLNPATRYVKWTYTKSGTINLTIDDVDITALSATTTITTGSITGSPFCVGNGVTVSVSVPYTITGTYTSGNIFTAQLSDATGSFTTSTSIGTLASTAAGTITATIPASIVAGTGYRIRVASDAPSTNGTDNGTDLEIQNFTAPTSLVSTCGNANSSSTWTNPSCFDQVMLVAKAGAFTAALPSGDGTAYTANLTFGSGTAFDGGFVVYKGTATSSGTINTLTNGTAYTFKIYVRKGTTWLAGGTQTCTPMLPNSTESDLVFVTGSASATIASTVNNATLTSITGAQVMQFTIRDGGSDFTDADAVPTILTGFTLSQGAGNQVTTWSDAILAISLFDGTTKLADGVISASTVVFSGFSASTSIDGGSKTLTIRLSLKCPLGADAFDGEDFVFSITNANTIFSVSGSGKTTFPVVSNPNDTTNVISVTATRLFFSSQPISTGVNTAMSNVVVKAIDACGNTDLSFVGSISLNSSGTMTGEPVLLTATSGVATYVGLTHTVVGTNLTMTASFTGLTSAISSNFDISNVTVLTKGDLAILAVNTITETTGDEFSFVCFKDILPGTQLFFTDNGYERVNAGQWGDTEGVFSIMRSGSTLVKGTVVTIKSPSGGIDNVADISIFSCGVSDDANWTKSITNPGFSFDLNEDDQIWIMQGGAWNNLGGSDHNATYSGNVLYGWTEIAWKTAPAWDIANGTKGSTIFPGNRCYSTDVQNTADGASYVKFNDPTNPDFSSLVRDKIDWIAVINDPANWNTYTNDATYDAGGYNYLGNTTCPAMTITAGTFINGAWTGRKDTNWFDCNNWDTLEVPDQTVNVTMQSPRATKNAVISSTATDASLFGGIAKCNNITIGFRELQITGNPSNILEVNGNLQIFSAGSLSMDDTVAGNPDGQIFLRGNWINSRNETFFKEGEGTVHFDGTIAQTSACGGGTPENYFNVNLANPIGFTTNSFTSDLIAKGNLTLSNGSDLTLKTGHYALAAKDLTVGTNSILEIEDDASLTQTDDSGIVTNNGTINVNKTSTPYVQYDYTFWSSPIVGETIGSVFAANPSNRRYSFNTANFLDLYSYKTILGDTGFPQLQGVPDSFDDSGDDWVTETAANTVIPGKGYSVMGPTASAATGQSILFNASGLAGRLNNGPINVTVSQDLYNASSMNVSPAANAAHTNNNLIGNPYASSIDLVELKADNSILTGTFYFWTHKTAISTSNPGPWLYNFSNDDYVTYTVGTGGSASSCSGCPVPDQYVDSCQGFYANVTGNGTVTFNNSQRVTGNNNAFYRNASNNNDKIWLDFNASTGESRQILVGFLEGAEDDYNPYYDGARLENGKNFDFFSFIPTNADMRLAVQGLSSFDSGKIVPLGVEITQAGTHSISINNTEGVFENGQSIYLQDNLTNTTHDFENGPYVFESEIGSAINNRFVLKFTNSSLGTENFDYTNSISIYSKDKQQVTINSLIDKITEVTIFDILGREIVSKKNLKDNEITFTNLSISNQTLIVKIKLENGSIITRKFII